MNEIDPNVVDEGDDFEGAYQLANTIVRECREAMEDHALESALLLLREAAERIPSSHELHSMAAKALQSASCLRYTRHGFPQDAMRSMELFLNSVGPTELSSPTVGPGTEIEKETGKIELALELIERYRRSASMANLNSAAYLYEIVLSDGTLTDPGRLPLLLATADCNCLRNAIEDSRDVLDMAVAQLEEVLRLNGDGDHSMAFCSLLSLSNAYWMKWSQDCNGESAWQAWVYLKQALQLDEEADSLFDSGTEAAERFEEGGGLHHLEVAITQLKRSLLRRPHPHPHRSGSLNNLANALMTRFEQKGVLADLEESIKHNCEALGLRPSPHPLRSGSLNNLANALMTHFEQKGVLADLEESIKHHREALGLRPSPHPARSQSLNNLANALKTHFQQKGVLVDLEESIRHHREALGLRPSPHPLRSISLNNLASALMTRFQQKGALADLEESIKHHREALGLLLSPHPDRSTSLNNLADALKTRFEQKGVLVDLEESIKHHREALGLLPSPHPDRSTSLNNLAGALYTRFQKKGVLADLEESIKHNREALALRPSPHPDRSASLNNLAGALKTRFEQKGVLADLEESIKHHREALGLRPSPHPLRPRSLSNLALALLAYDKSQHRTQNQAEAFSLFEESASYPYGSLVDHLQIASRNWAGTATELNHPSALSAYQCAIHLLPQLASIDLDPQHRQDVLVHAKDLATKAARCAIEAGKFEDAIVFSSTARAVFWSQSLQLRSPLDELQLVSPQLAERLRFLGQALEKRNPPGTETAGIADRRNLNDEHATYFRKLAEDWQQTLEEVRKHPGFEDFCKLPSFASLRDCAKRGPVVLLNASARGCDALVITQDSDPCHIPLHRLTQGLLLQLSNWLQDLNTGSGHLASIPALLQGLIAGTASCEPACLSDRTVTDRLKAVRIPDGEGLSLEEQFGLLLRVLWVFAVSPVIELLKLDKSATPMTRIWWCPSGTFSFLPIHAAGIYSGTDSDCLHDYAISSYCSSLQSLLTPVAPIEPDYKFLAIIEPEAPAYGACALPMTKVELREIEVHLPQPHDTHLLKHIGVAGCPTSVDNVLSDLRHASFVHFGCHGMQASNPLDSCLLLSGGRLTMSEIVQCQASKASLAYLSACETAQHDKERPDESLHLAATMMFAGFRSVVATLWSISDGDAPVVADVFYQHLFRNGSTQVPDVTESAYALHLGVKALRDRESVSVTGFLSFITGCDSYLSYATLVS